MAGFIVFAKLSQREAQKNYVLLKKWFKDNPERDDCVTDRGTVYRATLKKDWLRFCMPGVVLKDKPEPKKKAAKKPVKKTATKKAAKKKS